MLEFENLANPALVPGIVLRTQGSDRFLRVTHVFGTSVYAMWVSTPERARYARRPFRMTLTEIQELASLAGSAWGRLPLPAIQSETLPSGSEKEQYLEVAWSLLQPLIDAFDKESNLSRNRFASLISARAHATDSHVNTLRRMLLRYYYFGRTRLALLPLAPGLKPGQAQYGAKDARELRQGARVWKRRGRQPALAKMMGRNDFIVEEDDISDMVACLKRQLRQQATFISAAHESYLAVEFRRRHPTLYSQYVEKKRVEPVTARQYRYYTNLHANLSQDLAKNLRLKERNQGYLGSLRATGPGEVYEIDSTGGRFFLVSNDDPPEQLGTPTIYLIVDRWSRYVVSVYLSLKKPSYEEVRYALLIAFTSREKRFRSLNVDIDDVRWPVGPKMAEECLMGALPSRNKSMAATDAISANLRGWL